MDSKRVQAVLYKYDENNDVLWQLKTFTLLTKII